MAMTIFKKGFEPLLGDCAAVPFNDLTALESALRRRDVAAFIVEPIQGKGVHLPSPDYLKSAADLCRRYGSLFIADEIQCGLGRTGKFFAVDHWGVEPDMILVAKALSGGHVPVGALLTRKDHLRSAVQPDGPRRRAWFDLRQERSGDGSGHRDVVGSGIRKSDRERGPHRRALARRVSGDDRLDTRCCARLAVSA